MEAPEQGGTLITDGSLSIRRIRDDDRELRQIHYWRLEPHVRATWDNDDDDGGGKRIPCWLMVRNA